MAVDGLTTLPSSHGPKETMNRFEAEVKAKGMTVFARIDHAAGAAAAGLPLRPTELLIFGNTWLSYNDPGWLAKRHGHQVDAAVSAMAGALDAVARASTTSP